MLTGLWGGVQEGGKMDHFTTLATAAKAWEHVGRYDMPFLEFSCGPVPR
jgi:hypothetical protein